MKFHDRKEAGIKLAKELTKYKGKVDTLILALPRGGVIVGHELAEELHLPLDIIVARKIGAPNNEEFAIGAITETGEAFLEENLLADIPKEYIEAAKEKEQKEAQRRLSKYRANLPERIIKGKTIILTDDGIATGRTMLAAIKSIRAQNPNKIIVAVPVAPSDSLYKIQKEADEVICLHTPLMFMAVGQFYENFPQNTDEEVTALLQSD